MTTNHDPLRAGRAAFANAGLIQESKDSPPTTDELVEALRELREAEKALTAAVARAQAARSRAASFADDGDVEEFGSDAALCIALGDRTLEDRQCRAEPDNTPARFHFGDLVDHRGLRARVVEDGGALFVCISYPTGRRAWRPRGDLRLIAAAHCAEPGSSE